ncbi:MAG: sarcosine oxidase subunit alpha family protein [Defluviicoccus sp.]|nr:sarcosine oxidase subunit alpha family protein [Defluviicoccus sp.]MDE0382557.1 sarcosine oxidase subunit alpha family protein [Defluviicoccus sp.]
MTGQPYRLPEGGAVDRSRPIGFSFNGRRHTGFAGDTLASALLANGVHLVGRSFKYHRPRGILTAGTEEPNAIVQLGPGTRGIPNARATRVELYEGLAASSVNCWPGPGFDLGAVNDLAHRLIPAGFYYKTFMWPHRGWHFYERFIRRMAGLGRAPDGPDPDRYERMNAHCDVLVVGAGPAGLAAARAAGQGGARVILADERSAPGGTLLDVADSGRLGEMLAELDTLDNVRVLTRTTVAGYFDHNFLTALERVTDHLGPGAPAHLPRQRLWRIRAGRVVLATGALERPLVFANNDRPGVMLASAVRAYVNRFAVLPGQRAVVVTDNDSAYGAALDLHRQGMEIAAVVDLRRDGEGGRAAEAREAGLEILPGHAVVDTGGRRRVRTALVARLDDDGSPAGPVRSLGCDMIAMSGGWSPAVHLFSQSGGRLRYDEAPRAFLPESSPQAVTCAGAIVGTADTGSCIAQGRAAGAAEPIDTAAARMEAASPVPWAVPARNRAGEGRRFVDFQNDVTSADIALAAREGYESVEHVKRYTTLGMGTDQGKTGNVAGLAILAHTLGLQIPEVGTTTFRPPYDPVTFGAIAGRDVGRLADPVRRTPMHRWHAEAGAVFEDVGQWKRPFYYPRDGETKHDAVARECLAVRNAAGVMDASTLGKILVSGPDARELLNRVYTNAWDRLEVGRCRYGLMLGEDGMVMDDGVTACLSENRFLTTTTTGNASRIFAWLEEWLQTEWPDLRVYLTSLTEQLATVALAGPDSRAILGALSDDIDLGAEAFPFMAWREGRVAGLPARVFRVSYTGELSYEIVVAADCAMELWAALTGPDLAVTPFGTEAMHVLRAEKGYLMIGQETDGTVTPLDLDMQWILSRKKDFVGRRSLARPAMRDPMRKRLVGLETEDPATVLPEGAQILGTPPTGAPETMIGHVTSSYWSAALGRSIALALVRGGRDREPGTVHVPLDDQTVRAEIRDPRFYDPEGVRMNG